MPTTQRRQAPGRWFRSTRRRGSRPAAGQHAMSGPGLAVPPGRAGRLWLQRRLETARGCGADLLDRKLRILQGELDQATELRRPDQRRSGTGARLTPIGGCCALEC